MKFDIDENLFQAMIGLMQEAPVPHKVSNPVIQALLAQANDAKIQSLDYRDSKPAVSEPKVEPMKKKRGRPPKVKTNGAAAHPMQA